MGLINKEKVLRGVGKAVDAANNAADKVHDYAKEKELDKKAEEAVHKTENFIRENEIDKKVINAGKTLENGVIMRETGLSKAAFKRAVGRLYKERKITLSEHAIRKNS